MLEKLRHGDVPLFMAKFNHMYEHTMAMLPTVWRCYPCDQIAYCNSQTRATEIKSAGITRKYKWASSGMVLSIEYDIVSERRSYPILQGNFALISVASI